VNEVAAAEQQSGRSGNWLAHYAHYAWMVVHAVFAVVVGFSTLNMTLADSGLAVLNEHAAPYMTLLARLTRRG